MTLSEDTWAWFKTAPLPVVLAITLGTGSGLAGWLWAVDAENKSQNTQLAVVRKDAEDAKNKATRAEDKLDKANEKLDKLLEAIARMQGANDAERARVKREKK